MSNNKSSLTAVAKKPTSYVTDMESLKADIQGNMSTTINQGEAKVNNTNTLTKRGKNFNKDVSQKKLDIKIEALVGLNIPIPQGLRDKLKMKAITEGRKMKDIVLNLIEDYLEKL